MEQPESESSISPVKFESNLFDSPPTKMNPITSREDPFLSAFSVPSSLIMSHIPLFDELAVAETAEPELPDFIVYSDSEEDDNASKNNTDHDYAAAAPSSPQINVVNDEVDENVEKTSNDEAESSEEEEERPISPVVKKSHKKHRRGRKRKTEIDISEKVTTYTSKKTKLYQQGPSRDPETEKCRLNAINAKRNRDRLKQERVGMKNEIVKLAKENESLRKKTSSFQNRASVAENQLSSLLSLLKANNMEHIIRSHNELISATDPEE